MNAKRLFLRYLTFLLISLILTSIYAPIHYHKPYPDDLALQFEPGVKEKDLAVINRMNPEIVLIGDSTLETGVDADLLSKQSGIKSYAIPIPGSATAAWYLVMKNVLAKASPPPRYILVLFRDTMLTAPTFRTTGKYFELLDDYANRNEPLLSEIIHARQLNPLERFSEQYLPLYSIRWEIREDLDNALRHKTPSILFNCPRACSQEAIASLLGREVDMVAFNQMVDDSAEGLYRLEAMDFENLVERSFLPAMIESAQDNDFVLVFIRTRTLTFPSSETEPVELRAYIDNLNQYIAGYKNVYLLDFSQDPRITNDFFADSLHFNSRGRQEFTKILADELKSRFGK